MNKRKIAYIGQRGVPPTFGGVERYVDEIVKRLPENEYSSYSYCRKHYVDKRVEYTKQVFSPSINAKGLEAFSHSFFSSFHSLLNKYDLIHYQALGPALFSGIPKIRGSKIVVTVHGLDWARAKWGVTGKTILKSGDWMMGKSSDAIISVSKRLAKYYEDKYKKDVFFVPIGFSEPKQLPLKSMENKFGLEKNKYILFLNRLVPEKGLHYLIESFKSIKRDDFKLVVAGSGFHGDTYVDEMKKLSCDNKNIVFTGYISRDEVHELYSNAYIFALPSELEGMPAVVLEAMSHKCPVLVSDIPETLDIIESPEYRYGYVCENKNCNDLTKQLSYTLDNPDEISQMGEKSYNYVMKEFSWDKSVRETIKVYEHVLNK